MYYPCSENKDADQLCGYREADLRLCFRIGKNPVFSRCGSFSKRRCHGQPKSHVININALHLRNQNANENSLAVQKS